MLGQIVINNESVLTAVAEIFAHGATGVGSNKLQRCGIGRRGSHHDGVFHGAMLFQLTHHVGNGRGLLTNSHVDTGHILTFLINDGIHRHRRFAGLTIANDQFPLPAPNGHHGVDRLETRLHGLRYGFTGDNAGSHFFNLVGHLGVDGALAINGLTQGIHHAANQFWAHRYF